MPLKNTREVPLAADAGQADGALPRAESGPAVIAKYPEDPAGIAGGLSDDRCRWQRHLRRQGAQPAGRVYELRSRPANTPTASRRMIAATAAMEFVTVRTEAEALLLEANLIKRFRPRFNVLLRDDKSFPYILIAARP